MRCRETRDDARATGHIQHALPRLWRRECDEVGPPGPEDGRDHVALKQLRCVSAQLPLLLLTHRVLLGESLTPGDEPRPKAGAERTLEGVGSMPSLGAGEGRDTMLLHTLAPRPWSLPLAGAYNVSPL